MSIVTLLALIPASLEDLFHNAGNHLVFTNISLRMPKDSCLMVPYMKSGIDYEQMFAYSVFSRLIDMADGQIESVLVEPGGTTLWTIPKRKCWKSPQTR